MIISFPFSNGLIRQHYHLLIEMTKLLTVDKLLSFVSPVQYCGLIHFTRHSVHRKWRCGVLCYVSTHLAPFSLVFLLTMSASTSQEFMNQLGNCHLTLLFWAEIRWCAMSSQALGRIILEGLFAVLIPKHVTRLYSVESPEGHWLKTSFTLLRESETKHY